jgi:uncharacterized membrane protein YesL
MRGGFSMFRLEGIVYRICIWIYQFALLNLLFLVSCIPIITIYPSTAALFGVVRGWINKNDSPVFFTYQRLFKENLKQSFSAGIYITTVGIVLIGDYYVLTMLNTEFYYLILSGVTFVSFLFLVSVIHIFPLMVNSHYPFKQLLSNSFKFGFYKVYLTILNALFLLGWLLVSLRFSFLFFFYFFSISAFITYWVTNVKLEKIQQDKEILS